MDQAVSIERARLVAGVTGYVGDLNDEHDRFGFYESIIDEPFWRLSLLACLLVEADTAMSTTVALDLLERVAPWERDLVVLATSTANRERVAGRARDLQVLELFESVSEGEPSDDDLDLALEGSDWLQRRLAESSRSPKVRAALAERGRTRKVRARAGQDVGRESGGSSTGGKGA